MARAGQESRAAAEREQGLRAQARAAAIVILVAMVAWMAGAWAGGVLGLPVRFAFLLDLACLAALIWSLVVLTRVWLARRQEEN